jgi:integrase
MTDRLCEVIQSRYKYKAVRDSMYVFPHAFDTEKPKTGYLGALRNGIDKPGLNDPELVRRYGKFTVHSLRDSYATRLTEQGIVPSELMHLLGHANEEMSMKYIHMRPKDAIAKGTKLLNGIAGALPSTIDQSLVDAYEGNRL